MRLFRLLIALLAVLALCSSGQACLLQGQHVATELCADHDDGGHAPCEDDAAGCSACLGDVGALFAPALLPAPPLGIWTADLLAAALLRQRALQPTPVALASPPDPALLRRAFARLTRAVPARGPDLAA